MTHISQTIRQKLSDRDKYYPINIYGTLSQHSIFGSGFNQFIL